MLNKFIRFLAGFGLLYVVVKFLGDEKLDRAWNQLLEVSLLSWLGIITISILILIMLGVMFRLSIQVLNIKLPFRIAFYYTAMNSFFNTVLPLKGGVWIRGLYLNRYYQIPWSLYVFIVISSQLLQILILFGAVVFLFLTQNLPALKIDFFQITNAWALGLIILLGILLLVFLLRTKVGMSLLVRLKKGLTYWFSNKKLLLLYLVGAVIFHCLTAYRLFLSYEFSGLSLDLNQIVILYVLLSVGLSWAFTPGNIGVKEAAIVFVGLLIGIDADVSFTASIIDRAASLLVITVIGGASSYIASHKGVMS